MFDILVTLLVRYRKKCNSQHDRSKKGRAGRPVQALLTNGAMGFTPPDQHELDCSLCTVRVVSCGEMRTRLSILIYAIIFIFHNFLCYN